MAGTAGRLACNKTKYGGEVIQKRYKIKDLDYGWVVFFIPGRESSNVGSIV